MANGKVLVTGYDGAQLYDPDTGTWSATGKMVTPRYNHTATLLPDGGVLVAGGDVPPDLATDSAELYDPVTGSWTATANLRATGNPRFDSITATLLQDGTVLVVRSSTAEVYDPATGAWTATGELPSPGTAYRPATLLSDGIVLVPFSGFFPATPGSTVADLYDPDTRSWSTTAPMLRSHGTPAILLLDGTVLVAGGRDCLEGVCVSRRARRSCTSLEACRRPRCRPSRARLRQSSRPRPRSRPRSRPRLVPSRRAHGPGRSPSSTRVPNP